MTSGGAAKPRVGRKRTAWIQATEIHRARIHAVRFLKHRPLRGRRRTSGSESASSA